MELSDAVEIKQVFGDTLVNSHLQDGWKLLAVTSSSYGDSGKLLPCYVLGKPKPPNAAVFGPRHDPERR